MEEIENTEQQLQKKAVSGFVWKFGERIIAQGVSLIVSIILARILTPDDYSVVGLVTIFFAFANVFISGGFNTALIQKKGADREDYSSVLFISLIAATLIYAIIFICAPWIASAYEQALLVPIFRIMGITLFVNAFKSVLCAYISSHMQFRKFFFATIVGTIISAVVGIVMAQNGYGPWALVAQQMVNATIDTLILFATTRVRFVFRISKEKTKGLFKYSWKILVAGEISVLYNEINPLIVGLKYSGADLSFYTKGRSFPSMLNSTIENTLSSVLFPTMSKIQDDKQAVLHCTRKYMSLSTFLIFPMMLGFLAVAENFIVIVLTEKWLPATLYIQAFCIVYMFDMIQIGSLQVVRAIGRSDVILITEIVKKSLYSVVILLFIFLTNSPQYLALACIVNTLIATLVNTYPTRKLIGYRYRMQIMDVLPNFIVAVVMGVSVYTMNYLAMNKLILLVLQVMAGAVIYLIGNLLIKNKNLKDIFDTAKRLLKKKA